ncbi:MAG: protoporphyrinogen oxidase, partial [Acidimicrobiales bacterium]
VTSLDRTDSGRWRLACEPGPDVEADSVILAVPSFAAADLLERLSPEAAAELRAIDHASVAVVTLGYRPAALPAHPDGAGFLVPRVDGRLTTACTWTTSKWPELRRGGMVLLRASAGRFGDDRPSAMDDPTLVGRLHEEMAEALGITEEPETSLVDRWPRAFPQYAPGHAARVDRIETAVRSLGAVLLAGASYRGVGVAACIRQGTDAATRAL